MLVQIDVKDYFNKAFQYHEKLFSPPELYRYEHGGMFREWNCPEVSGRINSTSNSTDSHIVASALRWIIMRTEVFKHVFVV